LFVTSLDPKTLTTSTMVIDSFTLLDNGAWVPSDGIEASSDGRFLWMMVADIPCAPRREEPEKPETRNPSRPTAAKRGEVPDCAAGKKRADKQARCTNRRATPELEASYEGELAARKLDGRTPPIFITQFYKIDLQTGTVSAASEPYYGVLCSGLTQIQNQCRGRTRSDAMSFEAVLVWSSLVQFIYTQLILLFFFRVTLKKPLKPQSFLAQ